MKKRLSSTFPSREKTAARQRAPATSFPIVGVGASAGGLEAFTTLLQSLSPDSGMAFVLIQHLDPTQPSFLREALAKATPMPVTQAEDGIRIEPNRVYVIPPNAEIAVHRGRLMSLPRVSEGGKPHLPVDFFFRSLAAEQGNRAIGVILSGMASDGTEGLKAIKDGDGITFAQDPKTAKFAGMPRSALDAGVVDYCLPLPALGQELMRVSRHPYILADSHTPTNDETILDKIRVIVRNVVGVDYSEYKSPTFQRRLARRMALRRSESLEDYLLLLQGDEQEVRTLHEETLIHVTSFFRDPDVFAALKSSVFAEIMKAKAPEQPIRVWVAGCATGEEVYSLAIALDEFLSDAACSHPIQIFGTDVSENAIEKARRGLYQDAALCDVSEERRRRFFSKVENGYRINKTIRDLCVFVRHDLARDPPFSRIDLVSCRNVLIYFDRVLQKRVLPTLHYGLNQPGFLLLGRTESISGFGQLFSVVDRTKKIFARTAAPSALRFAPRMETHPPTAPLVNRTLAARTERGVDLAKHFDRLVAASYGPPGVLVNERMGILQFRGQTTAFLQQAPGEPDNNLFRMARGSLLVALRETIARAKKRNGLVRKSGVEVEDNGMTRICDIVVRPFAEIPDVKERLFVVFFEDASAAGPKKRKGRQASATKTRPLKKLQHELAATKEYLQALIEEHSRANDELGVANEELVSSNEELQSMNEELETAKEELQSTNEELTTVNDELNSRNQEIGQVNSDLINLLSTVEIPIIILDSQLRIRRFTPMARSILNVVSSDVGRPFDDIKPNIDVPDLEARIVEVIETLVMNEAEVQDRSGRWYRMQIRPYKTIDNRIDGVTLSLVDINLLKQHLTDAERAKDTAVQANVAKDQFLATLSHELRTPLSGMLLSAQRLLEPGLDSERIWRTSETIQRGVKTLVQLIDDLLDVSRIVTGKLKMELHAVELGAIVNAAIAGIAMTAEKKAIALDVAPGAKDSVVAGDATRLQQVVSNLLTNAIKFTPRGGKVSVGLTCANGSAELSVADTGVGIGPEFLPYVFDRFSQADSSNTRRTGGLGLGLAIARHILEQHGGSIRVESQGLGHGATFIITLPLIVGLADEGDTIESAAVVGVPFAVRRKVADFALRHMRILVVDDDPATHHVVSEMLAQRGAMVRVAESTDEAVALVADFKPTVVVSDIAMPGEDGFAFIRRVRALGPALGGDVPALALTALAGEEDRRRALSAGFQLHRAKPIDIDRLANAVLELANMNDAFRPQHACHAMAPS